MTPQHRYAVRAALHATELLEPLREKKDPITAALLGFFFGGIGLGLYFKSWKDCALPIAVWVVSIFVLGLPTFGLSVIAGWMFCAAYGYRRAKASNAKLAAQASGATVIDVEVVASRAGLPQRLPPSMPPMPQRTAPAPAERLEEIARLRDRKLMSEAEFEAKRAAIISTL